MQKSEKEFDPIKYRNEYTKKNYDRLSLVFPKGEKETIREKAKEAGQSINEYIYAAVKEKMQGKE